MRAAGRPVAAVAVLPRAVAVLARVLAPAVVVDRAEARVATSLTPATTGRGVPLAGTPAIGVRVRPLVRVVRTVPVVRIGRSAARVRVVPVGIDPRTIVGAEAIVVVARALAPTADRGVTVTRRPTTEALGVAPQHAVELARRVLVVPLVLVVGTFAVIGALSVSAHYQVPQQVSAVLGGVR